MSEGYVQDGAASRDKQPSNQVSDYDSDNLLLEELKDD